MYNLIANLYYSILIFRNYLFSKYVKIKNIKDIPIIINNRNRLTFLKQLITSLNERGYFNIIILDNGSTYPPLLEYYRDAKLNLNVLFLGKNYGYNALENIQLYKKIRRSYFVYTDPDVIPVSECPSDFLDRFLSLLIKYPKIQKVGFSLKIDDLPDHFKSKRDVINWEQKFYFKQVEPDVYLAPIDTTFALHRPFASISTKGRFKNFRIGYPYQARHMPWYNNSENLSDEELYYNSHVEIGTHWSAGISVKNKSILNRIFRFKCNK